MIDILQLVIFGLVLGSIISLGAIGVSLTFGILGFANFSHGDLMTFGAYMALVFVAGAGLPMPLALVLAMASTAALAVFIDTVLYRRFRRRMPVILLIASFGVALMLRSLVQLIWGPDNQVYEAALHLPIEIWGLRIKPDQIYILLGTVGLMIALHQFLQRTKMGKAMRALADNMDLALVTGINTERVVMWTWIIGGGLAAAAGVFLGNDTRLHPLMGWRVLLPIFAAAILGGIGRPYGAIAGGLILGVVMELSTMVITPTYKEAVAFALMVLMLIVRPKGLFGGR